MRHQITWLFLGFTTKIKKDRLMRLFVATPLSEELSNKVMSYQPPIKEGVRLVRLDLLHMTLQFIGDEDPEKVSAALQEIRFQRFKTQINYTGIFSPKKSKKILWLGAQRNAPLLDLHKTISASLLSDGIKLEAQKYTPHITLARCKRSINQTYLDNFLAQEVSTLKYQIDRFCLYHSYQLNGLLQYEPISSYNCTPTT